MADEHAEKAPDAYRTISEVADDLDLPQHVLRFWETRFSQIKPLKRGGGRRYYRPDDVALITGIRELLYNQGFTIKGVQKILREQGARHVQAKGRSEKQAATAPAPSVSPSVQPSPTMVMATTAEPAVTDLPVSATQGRAAQPPLASPPLSFSARQRLEAVLADLAEARRILDGARNSAAA